MSLKTLVIVDSYEEVQTNTQFDLLAFDTYLNDYPKKNELKTQIINLCDTERYLSKGYYCSLLAEARQHKSLPSVQTINQLRVLSELELSSILSHSEREHIRSITPPVSFSIYFGWTEDLSLLKLAKKIFARYPSPILSIRIWMEAEVIKYHVWRQPFSQLDDRERDLFLIQLSYFIKSVWRSNKSRVNHRWDMAILVNYKEANPPSNRSAIARFIKAATKFGIRAQVVDEAQLNNMAQYDALFIRETTAIDHHTYRLACKAQESGLIVLDDPDSILRCCNKVYLHDAFSYKHIPSPKTKVLSLYNEQELIKLEQEFKYPMVLKMPEGSFSKGVYKVTNRIELEKQLVELFRESALILVQEYLYTEYDWRIGVLNGRAIYACRYHMARNHWQIYNHGKKRYSSGDFDTLPTFEAPNKILDAAVKAASMVGDGLYGVDLKLKNNKVYVIEVNDNPNIDHKIEDAYLGDELYMLVMSEFQRRLEARGR